MQGNQRTDDAPIQIGDVALDLAQGRPVHVVEDTGQTAAEWSDANDYDLAGNYGNARLGTDETDAVFEVVYCSNAKSEPSKTYAMPESRLLRVETEAADGGRPVRDRIVRDVLAELFIVAHETADAPGAEHSGKLFENVAKYIDYPDDVIDEARELADVEQTITADE